MAELRGEPLGGPHPGSPLHFFSHTPPPPPHSHTHARPPARPVDISTLTRRAHPPISSAHPSPPFAPSHHLATTRGTVGRVLNRFSKDVSAVDTEIPNALNNVLNVVVNILANFVAIAIATPWFTLALVGIATLMYCMQLFFKRSTVALRTSIVCRRRICLPFAPSS